MITRRGLLKAAAGLGLSGLALGGYACVIEPGFMLNVTRYRITPVGWPKGLELKISLIADIHACEPFMGPGRIAKIANVVNASAPDIILLLGDFNAGTRLITNIVRPEQWAGALDILRAPLGVHAILGNHDWWHGPAPGMKSDDTQAIRKALKAMGASLYENDAVRLSKDGHGFWLVGIGDQLAQMIGYRRYIGRDDLDKALLAVKDDAPVILMAHEPFIFDRVPKRVGLTVCGHTHGGQVNIPFLADHFIDRRFPDHRIYGHYHEDDRHLVISAGLGESFLPIRFMRPPEIVEILVSSSASET